MTYARRPRGRSQHRLSEETSYSIICRDNYLSTDKPSHGALSCFNFLASTNLAAGGDSNLSIFSFSFSFLAHFVFKFFSPTYTCTSGLFHFRRAAFAQQLKSRVGLALAKAAALRITLKLDGTPMTSKSHTHPSHSETSRLLTSGIPVPRVTQCIRGM